MRGKLRVFAAGLLALTLVAAACGDDEGGGGGGGGGGGEDCSQTDAVTLQLQWFIQAQFAGYFAAQEQGFYADQCLDVTISEGSVDIVPQQQLADGAADFAIAWVPKALATREEGANIVNIAQVFQRSGTLQVSFAEDDITTVSDFQGRTVGNWGFGNEYELTAAISKFDVQDVELVGQQFDMLALLNGELDAAEAMIYNEYAQVLEAVNPATGELYQPEDLDVIDFNDPEVATAMLQDAVWVNAGWIGQEGNEDITVRFLEATFRGWIHCLDAFDECVDIVLDNGSTLGSSHQAWQLNEILGLIFPSTNGIGVMNDALWDQTVQIATDQIPELAGITVGDEAFRTDLAQAAVDALEAGGFDVAGASYTRRDIELLPGGE